MLLLQRTDSAFGRLSKPLDSDITSSRLTKLHKLEDELIKCLPYYVDTSSENVLGVLPLVSSVCVCDISINFDKSFKSQSLELKLYGAFDCLVVELGEGGFCICSSSKTN